MSKTYLQLTVKRGRKKPITIVTPQLELSETPIGLANLERTLKAGVESILVQLKYALKRP